MLKKFDQLPSWLIALTEAVLLSLYISLVGTIMTGGEKWFGNIDNFPLLGPLLFLSIFILSALISASIVLGYPFYTFWVKKDLLRAVKVLGFTALWLFIFILSYLTVLWSFQQ